MGCDRAPGFAIGEATRRRVPSPRAKATVAPPRSKQAATTKASSSRWVPRDSRQEAGDGLAHSAPPPQPSPAAREREASQFSLSRAAGEGRGGGALPSSDHSTAPPLEPPP